MIPPGITAVGGESNSSKSKQKLLKLMLSADDFYDPNSLYRDHIQYDGDGPGSAETDEIDNGKPSSTKLK